MIDIKTLLPELKKLVTELSEDLLARSTASAEIDTGLRDAYEQIEKGGRTSQAFEVWREDYLDQVAVAWVLGCVFVRFMEDNHLIDECWLAGEVDRRKQAEDSHELYFREYPRESDREYFEHVFHEVGKIPACQDLFAEGKTPLWAVGPSGDAAMKLLAFWREIDTDTGQLKRTFDVEDGDTRFLGDLYQNLSERARKKYALLQTPVFVEAFILDRTLDPAIVEFGLDEVRMIDPTCGSGHFLLGGFSRLFGLWIKQEDNDIVAAQKALDGVWGCDVNPFAVAVARFRLIVAALRVCGIQNLKKAPAWSIHLATGDSLLFGTRWTNAGSKKAEQQFLSTDDESWAPEIYACEDKAAISEVLGQQYHVVVGNPPYITVKDKSLGNAYRERYSTCHRQFSLAVPFTERFFDMAVGGNGSGFVGMITANSFMKREFGKKLIEKFFPKTDLTHVVDTSGAYIPGHGTPTVILLGRNRPPASEIVRAVLGIKGEPSTPDDPARGLVWSAILNCIDRPSADSEFVSTNDVSRTIFHSHPWSIGGGGAAELQQLIEANASLRLSEFTTVIGRGAHTGNDDAYVASADSLRLRGVDDSYIAEFVEGDRVRDWAILEPSRILFPYDSSLRPENEDMRNPAFRWLWPYKEQLWRRSEPNGTHREIGKTWFEFSRFHPERFVGEGVAMAQIATHAHFVLDSGGKVFNRSAPIIKFNQDVDEEAIFGLLGIMNSSAVCFWLKQMCFPKGGDHVGSEGARVRRTWWDERYDFSAKPVSKIPLPEEMSGGVSRRLTELASEHMSLLPDVLARAETPTRENLDCAREQSDSIRGQMIALQEELDWECYFRFNLLDERSNLTTSLPDVRFGERAFEIALARQVEKGEVTTSWFERHGIDPIVEVPERWPNEYQQLVNERIRILESNANVRLIEQPEYKRRWSGESWEKCEERALKTWLVDRLGTGRYWSVVRGNPVLQSVAQLSDKASGDAEFRQVASVFKGREDFELASLVHELIVSESVPLLPVFRYKTAGLRKRTLWERAWAQQRRMDAKEPQPVFDIPPKYATSDYQTTDYWRLRGKLDVPKEKFISYPHGETESDPSLVVGWAGWDHLQQATALVAYYDARKQEGWTAERLTPLLAGLDQLLPWIHQWHPEVDPEYNETAGTSFQTLLESEAQELGLTRGQIRNWAPPAKKKAAKKKAAKKPRKKKGAS